MAFKLAAPATERGLNGRFLTLTAFQEFAILLPLAVLVVHMTSRGLGLEVVGLAFAIRSVMVVLLEVPTGGLADAIGRKPIALLSQGFTLASVLALLLATDVVTAVIYGVLQGIGSALNSGSLDAWYVDTLKRVAPEADLQKNLGRVELVRSSAMLLGAGVGGALPSWTSGLDLPWPLAGFGVSLFAGVVFRVLVWVLTVVLVDEPPFPTRSVAAGFRAVPGILRDAALLLRRLPAVPYLLASMLASGVALISLETFWQPMTSAVLGADAENSLPFALFGALTGAALLVGSFVVMQGSGRGLAGNPARLAGFMQLLKGLAIALVGLATGGWQLGLGLGVAYFAVAGNNVPHYTLLNQAIPDERRSVMLSLNSLSLFLGTALGSSALGYLAARSGPGVGLWVGGAFTALASLAYLGVMAAGRRAPAVPDEALEPERAEAQGVSSEG